MTKLVVNIDKVAALRNPGDGNISDLLKTAVDCISFGADAIAVHPRPDGRHIRYEDVLALRNAINAEFHVEGYPSPEFMEMVLKAKPAQVTLVPDAPDAHFSNRGWRIEDNEDFLKEVIDDLQNTGIRVAIFIDTDLENVQMAAKVGADRVQLFTDPYAELYPQDPQKAVAPFIEAANAVRDAGLGVNAGHGLNSQNMAYLHQQIGWLREVSVGHALVSESLYNGFEKTIALYKDCLK